MAHFSTADTFRAPTPPLNSTPKTQTRLRMLGMVKDIKTQSEIYKEACKATKKSYQHRTAEWQRAIKMNLGLSMQCTKIPPIRRKSISGTPQTPMKPAPARRKSVFITKSELTRQMKNDIIREQYPVSVRKIVTDPYAFTLSPPDLSSSVFNARTDSSSQIQSLPNQRQSVSHTGAEPFIANNKSIDRSYSVSITITDRSSHVQSLPNRSESVCHTVTEPSMANNRSLDRSYSVSKAITDSMSDIQHLPNRRKSVSHKFTEPSMANNKSSDQSYGVSDTITKLSSDIQNSPHRRKSVCHSVTEPSTANNRLLDRSYGVSNKITDLSSHNQNSPNRRKSVCHSVSEPSIASNKSPDERVSVCITNTDPLSHIQGVLNRGESVSHSVTESSVANNKLPDQSDSVCNTNTDPLSHIQGAPNRRKSVCNTFTELSLADHESEKRCSSGNSTVTESSMQILGSSNVNTNQMQERGSPEADIKCDLIKVSQSPAAKRHLESPLGEEKCKLFKMEIKPEKGVYSIQKRLLLSEYVIEKLADQPEKIDVECELLFFHSDESLNTFCLENTFVKGLVDSTFNWVKSEVYRKSLSISISKTDIFNVLKKLYVSRNPEYVVIPSDFEVLVEANIGANVDTWRKSPDTNANTSSTGDSSNSTFSMDTATLMQRVNYPTLPPTQEAPNLAAFLPSYHHYYNPTDNRGYYHNTNSVATDRLRLASVDGTAVPLSPLNLISAQQNSASAAHSASKQTSSNIVFSESIVSLPTCCVAQNVNQLNNMSSHTTALEQQNQVPVNPKPNTILNPYYTNLHSGSGILNPHYNNIHAGTDSSLINRIVTQPILAVPTIAKNLHTTTQPTVAGNLTTAPSQHVYNNNQPVYNLRGNSGMESSRDANVKLPTKQHVENLLNSQNSVTGKQMFTLPLPQVRNSQSGSSTTNYNISSGEDIVSQTGRIPTNIQNTASARQPSSSNSQVLALLLGNPRTSPAFGELAIASPTTPSVHDSSQQLPVATKPNLPVHSARLHSSNSKPKSTQHDNSSSKTSVSPEDANTSVAGRALVQNGHAPSHPTNSSNFPISVIDRASTSPMSRTRKQSSHSTVLATQPRVSPYGSRMNPSPRAATTASPTTPCSNQKLFSRSTKSPLKETQPNSVIKFSYSASPNNQVKKHNQNPSPNYPTKNLPSPNNPNTNYYSNYLASRTDVGDTWHGNGGEYSLQSGQSRTSSRLWQPGTPVHGASTVILRDTRKPARIISRRQSVRGPPPSPWKPEQANRASGQGQVRWESHGPCHSGHPGAYHYPVQPEPQYPYMGPRGWRAAPQMPPPREMQPLPYAHHGNNSYYPQGNVVNSPYHAHSDYEQPNPYPFAPSNKSAPPPPPPYNPTGGQETTPGMWLMNQKDGPPKIKKRKEITEKGRKIDPLQKERMTRSKSDLQRNLRPRLNNIKIVPLLKEDIWSTIHGYDYKNRQRRIKPK